MRRLYNRKEKREETKEREEGRMETQLEVILRFAVFGKSQQNFKDAQIEYWRFTRDSIDFRADTSAVMDPHDRR